MSVHVKFSETLPLRASEWGLSLAMTTWGIVVLMGTGMFAANPSLNGFLDIADQPVWGLSALFMGILGVVALAINGFWVATPFIRAICAFLRCFVWLQIVFGLLNSGNLTTGLAIYPWVMILDLWNIYRAMQDAKSVVTLS